MAKILIGNVVSTKMDKTVVVDVQRAYKHPLYKKTIKRNKNYKAHVEGLKLKEGDRVKIAETKPISKHKHFVVIEKIQDK